MELYDLIPLKCSECENTEFEVKSEQTLYFDKGEEKSDKGVTKFSFECTKCSWSKSFNKEEVIKTLLGD